VLKRLERQGLVEVTEAGNANLYLLNRDHIAAASVLALVGLRGQLFQRISNEIKKWATQPVAVAVFGSAARGDGGSESDIDLFVIRPEGIRADESGWGADVAALSRLIHRWSGNAASVIQATPKQVESMISRNEPIIESLRKEAVSLVGANILDSSEVSGES